MNGLDLLIGVSLVSAVVAGYRVGLLARVCSWVGLLLGLVVTTENMGAILRIVGDPSRGDEALAMAVALFGGCWLGKAIGMSVGLWLHRRLPMRPLRTADRAAGAALGGTGVVVVVWLVLPLLAFVPGWPAEQSRASAVSRFVHERLPAPPGSLASLRVFVSGGVFPAVLGTFDRSPETRSSPAQVVLDPDVSARVRRSVVQVESVACGRILDGTGFVAGERLVLTNGHVVAGSKRVTVIDDEGIRHPAIVRAFDAKSDAALLAVADLDRNALARSEADKGATVAVFGHPGGGALRIAPGLIDDIVFAAGRDLYDRAPARRQVLVLASRVRPGDSGSPVVNLAGQVVGMAFAVAPDAQDTAYALSRDELDAFLRERPGRVGDTGPCIGG